MSVNEHVTRHLMVVAYSYVKHNKFSVLNAILFES